MSISLRGRRLVRRAELFLPRFHRSLSYLVRADCFYRKRRTANFSTKRIRHDNSFDFIQERNRWQRLVASNGDESSGVVIPLVPTQWNELVSKLESDSGATELARWLKHQEGVVTFPPTADTSLAPIRHHLGIDEGDKIVLLRVQDDERDTEGLKSTCKSLTPLISETVKWERDKVYKVVVPDDSSLDTEQAMLSYLLGCYSFNRYKTNMKPREHAKVKFPDSETRKETNALARATYLVRDLISTPAMDLTPESMQRCAESLVDEHDRIEIETIVGKDLLFYNGDVTDGHGCGMIYAVGAAATRPDHEPRLIRISYRPPCANSRVALVGKGVTFDTGGLNLKPGSSMLHMKKDMGGAAHVLGLFSCLVEMEAPIAIDVWLPVVENALGNASFRPGDVLTSVSGQTTEVGNTDAEGRLILGDALELASACEPDLIIDFATLTGAARVAMGTEVVPFFTNQTSTAEQLLRAAVATRDPVWQLPLWHGYERRITKSSDVADLRNIPSDNGLGGSITAALFLQQFVGNNPDGAQILWIHLDVYGMNKTTGIGEAQGLRSVFRFLREKYSNS